MEKFRILIVEDEGLVVLGIKEGLEHMGYEVSGICEAGEEALLMVRDARPDLILMDIRLKGRMDGIEVAEVIRKRYFIPVIFLTAHSDDGTLDRAKLSESYGYIIKPFEEKTLHAAIEIALYKARSEKKLRDSHDWFSMVFQSLGDGVLIADLHGHIKFINTTACVMLNRSEIELEGRMVSEVLDIRDRKTRVRDEIDIDAFIERNVVVEKGDCLLVTAESEELDVELTMSPLVNRDKVPVGMIFLFRTKKPLDKREEAARRELSKPVEIQMRMLPENGSSVGGVNIKWLFVPSRFGSGDLFNLFRLDESHVGFYVLDVMGHGFSAAIFAITLHNMLLPYPMGGFLLTQPVYSSSSIMSSSVPLTISRPAQVLADLNKRFLFEPNKSPFFTIVYCVIDTRNGNAVMARAGHMPPVRMTGSGEVSRLNSEGSAIGLFDELDVEEMEIEMKKGERLIFHTDGLVDSRSGNMEEYSFERFRSLLEVNHEKTTVELLDLVKSDVLGFRDEDVFDDDIALCILSYGEG